MARNGLPIEGFRGNSVDIPLTVGTILGTRSFCINGEGELTGVSVKNIPYQNGENVAVCANSQHNYPEEDQDDFTATVPSSSSSHDMNSCEHGFWAYFDQKDHFSDHNTISGILEGYGEVIVGDKGFRASKARVRALVEPDSKRYYDHFPLTELGVLFCILLALSAFYAPFLRSMESGSYDLNAFIVLLLVPAAIYQMGTTIYSMGAFFLERYAMYCFKKGSIKLSGAFHKKMFKKALVFSRIQMKLEAFEKVRENYPDVPIFSSYQEMLDNFPELQEQKKKWKKA